MTLRTRLTLSMILTLSACTNHTQLVVAVESDLGIPDELDEVRVVVTGPSGTPSEATQMLEGPGAQAMPLTLGVRPFGDALGPIEVRADGLVDGMVVVSKTARTSLVQGETRTLVLFLARECVGVDCEQGETCQAGACVSDEIDPESLPRWSGQVPTSDGGVTDGGPDAEVAPQGCSSDGDCTDSFDCTEDACVDGACTHEPDDTLCTQSRGGVCDAEAGCQYPQCTSESCAPRNPCETATCSEEGVCVRESLCATGEMCCAGACVPAGCSDGVPCTDDQCGATGCEHTPNTGNLCDDDDFCNGADTCADGACTVHAGNPCAGDTVCDGANETCTGCLTDADCPPALSTQWSACGGYDPSNVCDESGTRTRQVTTFRCDASGMCMGTTTTETDGCSDRDTDGNSCGDSTYSSGSCGGFSTGCDESGTRSRTRTDHVCAGGSCTHPRTTLAPVSCSRDTEGDLCNDSRSCTFSDRCTSGFCRGNDICGSNCTCVGDTCRALLSPESGEFRLPPVCELQ